MLHTPLLRNMVTARYFLSERIRYAVTTDDGQALHVSAPAVCGIPAGAVIGLRIVTDAGRLQVPI